MSSDAKPSSGLEPSRGQEGFKDGGQARSTRPKGGQLELVEPATVQIHVAMLYH